MVSTDNIFVPESTIGKILKDRGLTRKKKRVRREYSRIKYQWDKILPFEEAEMDTKDILDKDTLPKEIYGYVAKSNFIPKYQWTFTEPVTRIRFFAWSYSLDWGCGQVFGKNDLTPYQKLRSLGYSVPKEFCLFPTLILDRLTTLPLFLEKPKSVQEHLVYDRFDK